MAMTAFSILAFFRRNPRLEANPFSTTIFPVISGVILTVLVYFITVNFGGLAGAEGALAVFLPGLVLIAAIIGLLLALRLKAADPSAFARLGAGQEE